MSEKLPEGIWEIVANGHRGELDLKVKPDGQISGTAKWGIGTKNEYEGNIFGFWDDIGWKITFLREHQVKFTDPNHPNANEGHHRDQVYTGYMWKGTTTVPPPPYSHCLAGSFIAFGGSMGTGGTKDRSEFGWVATFPSSTSNLPSKGLAEIRQTIAEPNQVSGAPYPPIDIHGEEQERNEDKVPEVPIGPFRGSLSPSLEKSNLETIRSDQGELGRREAGGGAAVIFERDDAFGNRVTFSGIPPDMSGAMRNDIVLMTGNTFAAMSTDGGNTFNLLNITTIFPSGPTVDAAGNLLDNGLCCDQVIQYAPQIDRFIWLMQFGSTGPGLSGSNKIRIASASPDAIKNSGGTSWTYWDLTSGMFSIANSMDYPDMSVGTNSLYISTDAFGQGLLVMSIPLQEIQRGGTINIGYTNPTIPTDSTRAYGAHITQNTGDEVFWAGHVNTSRIRIFNWHENSSQYSWRDIDINSWPNSDYSSACPDGTDWLNFLGGPPSPGSSGPFPRDSVIGATRVQRPPLLGGPAVSEVWFAWSAGRGGGFPHPHVQVVQIDTINWTLTNQWQIWNPDHAFAYPCLSTNSAQEVGISLGFGGKSFYANHAVGILGDFILWYSELSDAGPPGSRWGDYVTIRQASPKTGFFAATGFSVLANTPPAIGTRYNPRYILFGRSPTIIR